VGELWVGRRKGRGSGKGKRRGRGSSRGRGWEGGRLRERGRDRAHAFSSGSRRGGTMKRIRIGDS